MAERIADVARVVVVWSIRPTDRRKSRVDGLDAVGRGAAIILLESLGALAPGGVCDVMDDAALDHDHTPGDCGDRAGRGHHDEVRALARCERTDPSGAGDTGRLGNPFYRTDPGTRTHAMTSLRTEDLDGESPMADSPFQRAVRTILAELDPAPEREGLRLTPQRVERAFRFYCQGYREDPKRIIEDALFEPETDEMVVVRDIEIYSLCEHHLAPFFGKAHVAYVPDGKITGLSKIARLVDVFARRLQIQERLTQQIARAIDEALHPKGVGVVIDASHLCMMMRGVQKQNSSTVTSCLLGAFRRDERTRAEFLNLVKR